MARALKTPRGSQRRAVVPSMVMLALWRLRRTWGLLLVTGLGMVSAVMLVCSVPLYSDVAMTAGLRDVLNAAPQNADVVVYGIGEQTNPSFISKGTGELNSEFQQQLEPYLTASQFSVQSQIYFLAQPGPRGTFSTTPAEMQFFGGSMPQTASHVRLLQGRLPSDSGKQLEVALPRITAQTMKAKVGSVVYVHVAFVNIPTKHIDEYLPVHVVGIFNVNDTNDSFWHQVSFAVGATATLPPANIYTGLVSNANFLSVLTGIFAQPGMNELVLEEPVSYYWYFRLNVAHISISDLDALTRGVDHVQVDVSNNFDLNQAPYIEQTKTILPSDILQQFSARVPVVRVPVMSLLFLVLGLVLFFISMMADLLVDRQADTIAVLRSRGASRGQIFGSLVTQSIGLGIVTLIFGPLLALLLVRLIALHVFTAADQSALDALVRNPLQTLVALRWYALAAVGIGVVAMMISLLRTVSRDVISMRRESARATTRPLWQRLNLDIVFAIIMLVGYGASFYVTGSGVLDPQLQLLLLTPLTLVGTVFLLLACMLLFLRLFPLLLQWGSWLASRNRGASPVLALAQMARAPRQSARMTLLLALATAFAIFTLVFTASQAQRIVDVSDYQGGADFSGTIVAHAYDSTQVAQAEERYKRIGGVLSASVGSSSTSTAASGSLLSFPVEIRAVDTRTFANTAIWTRQDSSQSLAALMAQLAAERDDAIQQRTVPAVVDAATWNELHVTPGSPFTLSFPDGLVNFVAVAEVQHIPTISDNAGSGSTSATAASGGILADYVTYATVYQHDFSATSGTTIAINTVWLRTRSDPAALANVRRTLNRAGDLQLSPLSDRRQIVSTLDNDPLYLNVMIVLALGATTALLLALLGNLLASWLSTRSRLTNFAVLRALGAPPRQLASVLTWEQAIIYTTSMVLGLVFGLLLSTLVVPVLVFTSVGSNGANGDLSSQAFYVAQSVPPIHVIIPATVGIALLVLICICVIALGMMIRVVSRPSVSHTLRLNED